MKADLDTRSKVYDDGGRDQSTTAAASRQTPWIASCSNNEGRLESHGGSRQELSTGSKEESRGGPRQELPTGS